MNALSYSCRGLKKYVLTFANKTRNIRCYSYKIYTQKTMNRESDRLRNNLRDSDEDLLNQYIQKVEMERSASGDEPNRSGGLKRILLAAAILFVGFLFIRGTGVFSGSPVSFVTAVAGNSAPSEDLLNRMNASMVQMGYTDLTHDDLRSLRADGVTATYISNVRSLGFNELTLDESRMLAKAGASSTFLAMMLELGYEMSAEEFARLRSAGVTAHFTSNIHDLGYRDVTPDQLIRMKRIGVTPGLVERLQSERGEDITMEEIIRYRISNQ